MIRGWKEIARALGVQDVRTARKMVERLKIPVIKDKHGVFTLRSVLMSHMTKVVKKAGPRPG